MGLGVSLGWGGVDVKLLKSQSWGIFVYLRIGERRESIGKYTSLVSSFLSFKIMCISFPKRDTPTGWVTQLIGDNQFLTLFRSVWFKLSVKCGFI